MNIQKGKRDFLEINYNQEIANEVANRIISVYKSLFDKFLQVMSEKESLL
jgi:hypothetical protein